MKAGRAGTSGGKYHYEIEAEIEGEDRDITYSNGEKITVNNGKEKKEKQSDNKKNPPPSLKNRNFCQRVNAKIPKKIRPSENTKMER